MPCTQKIRYHGLWKNVTSFDELEVKVKVEVHKCMTEILQPSSVDSQRLPKMVGETKFWRSPDLVSQLLPFLDLASTLHLASILPLVLQLLQRKSIWRDLIRRSIENFDLIMRDDYEEIMWIVDQLVDILKMLESPELLLQDVLHVICEIYKDSKEEAEVILSCTCLCEHKIEFVGFQILEVAEEKMGTSLQNVIECSLDKTLMRAIFGSFETFTDVPDNELHHALVARLSRQTQQIHSLKIERFDLASRNGPNAILLQKCQTFQAEELYLKDLDEEDWSWLANLLQEKGQIYLNSISMAKEIIVKAKKEDLKTVWDCGWPWKFVKEKEYEASYILGIGMYLQLDDVFGRETCRAHGEDWNGDYDCPYQNETDADPADCYWSIIQDMWNKGQNA